MNNMVSEIDELIKYLIRVFNGIELTLESEKEKKKYGDYTKKDEIVRSQEFFISTKDIDKILGLWFGGFKNEEELKKTLKFKLGEIKKLTFQKGENDFHIVKDRFIENTTNHSIEWHNNYSYVIHSHLIRVFEERLNISVKDVIIDFPVKPSVIKKIEFDTKMWNASCFKLFNYLKENYHYKKVDLISIWFFLYDLKSEEYVFRSTKSKYIDFIKTQYEIKITNRDRSLNWDEKKKALSGLYIDFKSEQKQYGNK